MSRTILDTHQPDSRPPVAPHVHFLHAAQAATEAASQLAKESLLLSPKKPHPTTTLSPEEPAPVRVKKLPGKHIQGSGLTGSLLAMLPYCVFLGAVCHIKGQLPSCRTARSLWSVCAVWTTLSRKTLTPWCGSAVLQHPTCNVAVSTCPVTSCALDILCPPFAGHLNMQQARSSLTPVHICDIGK